MKFLNMFDKLDDIIHEPVKLICDVFRQPLKNADAKNERLKIELDNKIKSDMKRLDIEIELNRQKGTIQNLAEERKINEEINEMIYDNQLKRQEKMINAARRYQQELGEASVKLSDSIGKMSVELRALAWNLVQQKTNEYTNMQNIAIDSAQKRLSDLEKQFPNGGKGKEIIENIISIQLANIIENSTNFIKTMNDDVSNMTNNIDEITKLAKLNIDKYLSPMITKSISNETINNTEISYEQKKYLE